MKTNPGDPGKDANREGKRPRFREFHVVTIDDTGDRFLGFGMTIAQLMRETSQSRSNVYKDLAVLRDAGAPITSELQNGEARHRFLRQPELPTMSLTTLQITALHLARAELEPLAEAAWRLTVVRNGPSEPPARSSGKARVYRRTPKQNGTGSDARCPPG